MKYQPKNKQELQALCKDESVYLGDIDTSLITDMSELFRGASSSYGEFYGRRDFRGIESWDVSSVVSMNGMFYGNIFLITPLILEILDLSMIWAICLPTLASIIL